MRIALRNLLAAVNTKPPGEMYPVPSPSSNSACFKPFFICIACGSQYVQLNILPRIYHSKNPFSRNPVFSCWQLSTSAPSRNHSSILSPFYICHFHGKTEQSALRRVTGSLAQTPPSVALFRGASRFKAKPPVYALDQCTPSRTDWTDQKSRYTLDPKT